MRFMSRYSSKRDLGKRVLISWIITFLAGIIVGTVIGGIFL